MGRVAVESPHRGGRRVPVRGQHRGIVGELFGGPHLTDVQLRDAGAGGERVEGRPHRRLALCGVETGRLEAAGEIRGRGCGPDPPGEGASRGFQRVDRRFDARRGLPGSKACRRHDVERVVVDPAVGDQQVVRFGHGRTDDLSVQVGRVLRQVGFHAHEDVRFTDTCALLHDQLTSSISPSPPGGGGALAAPAVPSFTPLTVSGCLAGAGRNAVVRRGGRSPDGFPGVLFTIPPPVGAPVAEGTVPGRPGRRRRGRRRGRCEAPPFPPVMRCDGAHCRSTRPHCNINRTWRVRMNMKLVHHVHRVVASTRGSAVQRTAWTPTASIAAAYALVRISVVRRARLPRHAPVVECRCRPGQAQPSPDRVRVGTASSPS